MIPNILSIAGSDSSGGAGIQADIKAISANGGYAMTAITALTAQNTRGVSSVHLCPPDMLLAQIAALRADVRIDAVKIGMIANAGIAGAVADRLTHHRARNIVLDPVMVAKSGHALLDPEAVSAVRDSLVPLARVITPNLPEAVVLLDRDDGWTAETMQTALPALLTLGSEYVLLKGGHLAGAESTDLLAGPEVTQTLRAPRIATTNDHGTGCTLSSAIAALLPHHDMAEAVARARARAARAAEAPSAEFCAKCDDPIPEARRRENRWILSSQLDHTASHRDHFEKLLYKLKRLAPQLQALEPDYRFGIGVSHYFVMDDPAFYLPAEILDGYETLGFAITFDQLGLDGSHGTGN